MSNDSIRGAVKIDNLPDRAEFCSWNEFLNSLSRYLTVELPPSITNVLVGAEAPTEDDRNKLWFRRDNSGGFVGLYLFQGGAWRPFYPLAPGQVAWIVGNSNSVPEGFQMIDVGDTQVPTATVSTLMGLYITLPGGGGYAYYAARYVGY